MTLTFDSSFMLTLAGVTIPEYDSTTPICSDPPVITFISLDNFAFSSAVAILNTVRLAIGSLVIINTVSPLVTPSACGKKNATIIYNASASDSNCSIRKTISDV